MCCMRLGRHVRQKILRESGKRRARKSTQIALFFENGDIVRHMKKRWLGAWKVPGWQSYFFLIWICLGDSFC